MSLLMDSTATLKLQSLPGTPVSPENFEDLGIRKSFLEALLVKILYFSGPLTIHEWSELARVNPHIVEEVFQRLRSEQLCEVTGMVGNSRRVAITGQGRSRALGLLSLSQYAGPTPVSLKSYVQQVRAQSVRNLEVHSTALEKAFAHLVLEDETRNQLGTALNSGGSIFLHGPTGAGKTTIAEALPHCFSDEYVWIPYAVEVDGQVITVHDPVIHKDVPQPGGVKADARWVLCQRPTVIVGGELTIEMLDLQFNPVTKFYTAPGQMKANNGVLIIDDFGRQRVKPEELLNRWVVPLDRRIDFLTLAGGKKIEIPFELFVVFATNMDPAQLVDAAFLRRIQTKVKVGVSSEQHFHEIFKRVCENAGLQYDPVLVHELVNVLSKLKEPLRPCYPRDLVNQICWAARYEDRKPRLDRESLIRAVDAYFVAGS
jgi:hypothetical protein